MLMAASKFWRVCSSFQFVIPGANRWSRRVVLPAWQVTQRALPGRFSRKRGWTRAL
jgi:hypothetical protein